MASFFNFSRRAGTVRAVKPVPGGSKGLTLKAHIEQALGAGTIEAAVRLPRGEDPSEWVAVNLVLLYNALSVLYHVLDDTLCTPACCPAMTAGPTTEYLWADGARGRAPARLAAPDYVNALFDWAEAQLDDPGLFPRGVGAAFPREFPSVARAILKRLSRVYGHIYHSHFRQVAALGLEPHLATCFRHFVLFVREFDLVDEAEMAPVRELMERIAR